MKGKKILVTGATGFLGTKLCDKLESSGNIVTKLNSKNCDLRDQNSLRKFNDQYDIIYHLAVWTQAGDFCLHHQGEQWIINQQINTNVLSWWKDHQPQAKIICIGTSCAYDPDMKKSEDNFLKGLPEDSLFSYAMTKRMLYSGLISINRQFGLKYMMFVPNTLYGSGYHTDERQLHFIFDLIKKILHGKLYDAPVVLWGDGYQKRELTYVNDFIANIIKISEHHNNDIVNVSNGEEFTIRHYAKIICDKIGYDFDKIKFDTSRYVGAKSKCLDVTKLRNMVPDLKLTPLEVGLSSTIDWFLSEKNMLKKS
ncbi:NAD-dependent epimerase/dehydratase family protein [archaeon]|nr:NAD-dependent epimerase/dehydratase family protein [archaeon]